MTWFRQGLLAALLLITAGLLAQGSNTQAAPVPVSWKHLSSREGDLPTPPGSDQQTLCLATDVDHDGRTDIVIGCRTKAPALVWYRNTGKGWKVYVIDDTATPLEAGGAAYDIDGDGDLDIVAGNDYEGSQLYWYENPYPHYDPRIPWKRHVIKTGGGRQLHDQLFGRFTDGGMDLVFWNQGANALYLAPIPRNPKIEPWPYHKIYSGPGEGLAAGDVDGDGRPDIVIGGRWLKYDGKGGFDVFSVDASQTVSRVAVGDFNGDGKLDLVMSPGEGVGRLKWYEQRGNPERSDGWVAHDLLGFEVKHAHSLAVADFNGDGHPDIFCAEMGKWVEANAKPDNPDARIWIFYGDGKGHFTANVVSTGIGTHEDRVADLNGDGRPDIVGKPYNQDTPRLDLWINRGPVRPGR